MKRLSTAVALVAKCAILSAALLLLSNLRVVPARTHVWLGAIPLALAGGAYAILQIRLKPERSTLLKRLLLAATFVLWAIDQFLPAGRVATIVGDVVVAAYVVDLYWIIQEQNNSAS
jgi:hypothetical protein